MSLLQAVLFFLLLPFGLFPSVFFPRLTHIWYKVDLQRSKSYCSTAEMSLQCYLEQGNGLLIMVYATGSTMDHKVGPAVNGLLGLEGGHMINATTIS